MARKLALKQFVYKYANEKDITQGYTPDADICQLLNNQPIASIGLQAPPGTKAEINGATIVVGPTGVFELDDIIEITSFKLVDSAYLRRVIIDILYEKGE